MSFEITEEMQRRYRNWVDDPDIVDDYGNTVEGFGHAAEYLRDAVAAWMWVRFVAAPWYGAPQTNWTWEQWQAEAHKRLMGES
jgi:hypothetical protein